MPGRDETLAEVRRGVPRTAVDFSPEKDLLFVGLGASAVNWYRCVQPALALGADWVGLVGDPPGVKWRTGLVRGESVMPDFGKYKVIVLQQPAGKGWVKIIRELQSRGTKCLFEIDDFLHAVPLQKGHDFAENFTPERLREYEMCMKACDAMIVSTEYLGKQYADLAQRIYVCENGIDLARYALTKPERPGGAVNVIWAGATGHNWETVGPWLQVVLEVMKHRENVNFISIGQPFAQAFHDHVSPERALSIPFAAIEQYPAALTMGDIALAPAGRSAFYRAKSDLRWLEAGALSIPIIADALVYKQIRHGVNGFKVNSVAEMKGHLLRLIDDEDLRTEVGGHARRYVEEERSFPRAAQQWVKAIRKELRKGR